MKRTYTSRRIEESVDVISTMDKGTGSVEERRKAAVKEVAANNGIKINTVADKITRQLDIETGTFDELYEDRSNGGDKLRNILHAHAVNDADHDLIDKML